MITQKRIKYQFKPTMSTEDFVKTNEQIFIDIYLDSNPHHAHKINDGDLEYFYDHIDWSYVKEVMCDCYSDWLDENF